MQGTVLWLNWKNKQFSNDSLVVQKHSVADVVQKGSALNLSKFSVVPLRKNSWLKCVLYFLELKLHDN